MHVPVVVYHVPHVEVLIITCVSLKLIAYSSGQSVLWDQRAIAYPLSSSIQKCLSCTGQILGLTMSHMCLLHSLDFGLGANDQVIGTPFNEAGSIQHLSRLVASHSMHRS